MRSLSMKMFGLASFTISAALLAMGATISGTVKAPDGKPFEGAFIGARNATTNIETYVLSQEDGSYAIPNLTAGKYRVTIRAAGYKAAPQTETLQAAHQNATRDFSLEKGSVTWSDISLYQADILLPKNPGRDKFFQSCFGCHNFQSRIANQHLSKEDWLDQVNYMRMDVAPAGEAPSGKGAAPAINDESADLIATYLSQVFGLDSTLPKSPADLPAYAATVTKFSPQAMNIVYVVYPLYGSRYQMPFQMYPPTMPKGFSSDGFIWTADFGDGNQVIRINPETGEQKTYRVPTTIKGSTYPCKAESIHAIEVDPYGNPWFAEQGCNRVGTVNVKTGEVTQYQEPYDTKAAFIPGGYAHDAHPMLVDGKLYVFTSGEPPARLDPATGQFTPIPGAPTNTYDVYGDPANGNVWYTDIVHGPLMEVNPKTLKTVMSYLPPTDPQTFRSHRIAISQDGIVWLTCRVPMPGADTTRVCRLDPKTKAFKEYTPIGPDKHDYGIALDQAGNVWYSMTFMDQIQRLNPGTGDMLQYPFPFPEITIRKMWSDAQGRIWWASNGNAAVGYFYLAGRNERAAK